MYPYLQQTSGNWSYHMSSNNIITAIYEAAFTLTEALALTENFPKRHWQPTLGRALGVSSASFLAAASIEAAAPNTSFSAMTFGSSGLTQSAPGIET